MKRIQKALVEYAACTCVITLLFAGPALAQGTWQTLPDGDANQNSPALHSPALNQIAQAGEMEVLNGPVSFHVRNHLAFGLLADIRRNWQQTLSEKGLVPTSDQKSFSVEFTEKDFWSLVGTSPFSLSVCCQFRRMSASRPKAR